MTVVDKTPQGFRPPGWAWNLLRAYLDPTVNPTVSDRCRHAGIDRKTFYARLKRPEFVEWFKRMLQEGLLSEMSDVRQAHFRECLKGNLEAIRLWYERYGEFVPTERHIFDGDLSRLPDAVLDEIQRLVEAGAAPRKGPAVN